MNGVIKTLKEQGFGFIAVDGQSPDAKDLFFHNRALVGVEFNDLHEGDRVTFELDKTGPKGPAAVDVKRVE